MTQTDTKGSFQNILTISKLPPDALVHELISRYSVTIPEQINNADDLKEAGKLLGRLANIKTFFTACSPISKSLHARKNQKDEISETKPSALP